MLFLKSRFILAAVALLGMLVVAENVQAQARLNAAMGVAQQTGRPMLVVVGSAANPACQQLKANLADPALRPILAEYICLWLDLQADQADSQAWLNQYPAPGDSIPVVYIVTARGDQLFSSAVALQGQALFSVLSDNLAAARRLAADALAAQGQQAPAAQAGQGQQAPPAGPAAGPFGGQNADQPFGPLQDHEEEPAPAPVAKEEPEPAVIPVEVVEEPAEPASPPAREEPAAEDTELTRAQIDRRLDGWLRMAASFSDTRPEKTREYAQRIIELAPTSRQAAEARVLLRSLD